MHIIAGERRGAQLFAPKGMDTRPTQAKVKESLFNIIQAYVPEASALDLFAGSGQLAAEVKVDGDENKAITFANSYSADGTGIFGKLGVIVTPGHGLRFGAAIQTPTSTTITEKWQDMASTSFTDAGSDGEAESDLGESRYTFNAPWRFNFGIAYTLGKFAAISADYEAADYGGMRYHIDRHDMSEGDIEYFEDVNEDIRNAYGTVHQLRVGAELKPLSFLAIRAGYNLKTAAQKKEYDFTEEEYIDTKPVYYQNLSFGLGYSSKKSFFADLACRYTFASEEFIYPYSDYLYEQKGILSPEILNIHSNWKLLLTLGWRF